MNQEVVNLLKEKNKYSYLIELLKLGDIDEKLINTVELFTVGNYQHYLKYQQDYIELDTELIEKLIKLTIISICNDHENSQLNLSSPEFKSYGLPEELDKFVIDLIFNGVVNVKIDQVNNCWIINESSSRDVYNSRIYNLKVLNEDDIKTRSVNYAVLNLKNWVNDRLIPLKLQFDEYETKDKDNEKDKDNTRKRKTPDNT
ncbi:unnamed protein product [Candida verbasci]|uniref:PCI domain-containing protein n=1 Tax=Candida verbasci TaxID=1227364 RepID=A0A9W4TVC0_9ASCO|nr:unnamed protein product [Candida verbasci]